MTFPLHYCAPCSSNCVINLSPDKRAVLAEAFKALKVSGCTDLCHNYCTHLVALKVSLSIYSAMSSLEVRCISVMCTLIEY